MLLHCRPNLLLFKNQNQMISRVMSTATNKKQSEIESMLQGQTILTSEQAKDWGLVQAIKEQFLEPGARLVTVNLPVNQDKQPKSNFEYRTLPDFSPTTIQWPVSGAAEQSSSIKSKDSLIRDQNP
jgi:hypothetical protein